MGLRDLIYTYLQGWNWQYFAEHNPALATALALLVILVLAIIIFQLMVMIVEKRVTKGYDPTIQLLRRHVYGPAMVVLIGFGLVLMLPVMPIRAVWIGTANRLVAIYQIAAMAWLLIRIITFFRALLENRYRSESGLPGIRYRSTFTQFRIFERVAIFVIVIMAIITGLLTFDSVRQVGGTLLASAGVVGVIVGFAAQRSISTVLAGIQIAISQPLRLGDVVIIEKDWGRVDEITLTYVALALWDERRVIVPINHFIEKPFYNWSRQGELISGVVILYVDYMMPVESLRQRYLSYVAQHPLWDRRRAVLQVTGVTDRVMEVRLLTSAANSEHLFDLRCDLREAMIAFIQENYAELLPKNRVLSLDPKPKEGEDMIPLVTGPAIEDLPGPPRTSMTGGDHIPDSQSPPMGPMGRA